MLKFFAVALLFVTQSIWAQTWSYDFSGSLSDHFEHFDSSPALSSATQTGGGLEFHTIVAAPSQTSETFVFKDASFTPLQSWMAHLDVAVPSSLNQQSTFGSGSAWAATSLFAIASDSTGTFSKMVQIDLEADPPSGSTYFAGAFDLSNGTDLATPVSTNTNNSTGTLALSFDAGTKTISAFSPAGQVFAISIVSWGLGANDRFRLAVGFDTQNMAVPQGKAMSLDNFSVTAVPEPDIYALMLAGIGLVALRRRGELAVARQVTR